MAIFAPRLEHELSGAMWEVDGSESLQARQAADQHFGGTSSQSAVVVLSSTGLAADAPAFQDRIASVEAILAEEPVFRPPASPQVSQDGHTVVIQAGTLVDATEAVRAAGRVNDDIQDLGDDQISVSMSGVPAFWADFNEMNSQGMRRAEVFTWPVTAVILVLAFGSLAAAGLPLLLTAAGLIVTMGILFLITQGLDLSIWTLNFAMMFALALGIDYALFIVTRFRNALHHEPDDVGAAVAATMDSAGKAVLFSGITVVISLSAVLLVPVPAFRSMAAGMMLAVTFVLLAALTLLPALIGPGVNRFALPWHDANDHRSQRWAGITAWIQSHSLPVGVGVTGLLLLLASPLLWLETGMPSITVLGEDDSARQGYEQMAAAFGPGGPGPIQVVVPPSADAQATAEAIAAVEGVVYVAPPIQGADGYTMLVATTAFDPSSSEALDMVSRLRGALPVSALVGGPVAENYDLDQALIGRAPLVIGVVLLMGFALLVFALQGLLIAIVGVVLNLLSVAAGFGLGVLAFQDGWLAGPMGFESQGYLTSWAPLFFFALIFAISMDYTVFLLASAREHYDNEGDADLAMQNAMAHTARPIIAAAAVMVTVFFTFAITGTLPMKEMGFILGAAVLADAFLVRLILVPSVLHLLGEKAWWLPRWADRLLPDVRFGH
jgi:RND superfamily putative drug exporter